MEFLKEIEQYKKVILENKDKPLETLIEEAYVTKDVDCRFKSVLNGSGISLIAEVKMASPSKGDLSLYSVEELASIYEECKVSAVSVLTEDKYFRGSMDNINKVKSIYRGPVLMKDFIISEYQIYEGIVNGAAAVLLIVAMLSKEKLNRFLNICKEFNISALVEVHSEEEIRSCLDLENLEIIGVNSRNLKTLKVNTFIHKELAKLIPAGIVKVAESGISGKEYIKEIYELGYNGILIGESIVTSDNPRAKVQKILSIGKE